MAMAKFCTYCGAALKEGSKFCTDCGKELKTQAATQQQPEQPVCQKPVYRQLTPARQQANTPPPLRPVAPAPVQPAYQAQTKPPKRNGSKKPLIAIAAGLAAVALIFTGIFFIPKLFGSTVNSSAIKRGESAAVSGNRIELGGTTLDFGSNNVSGGATMTVLLPTDEQKPLGAITGMYELAFDRAYAEPVTVSIPSNDLKTQDDEIIMLMVGVDFHYDDGSVITNYNYIAAEAKDGCLTATFIPDDYGEFYAKSSDGGIAERTYRPYESIKFLGTKFRSAASEHFIIHYSDFLRQHSVTAYDVLDHLEDAYKYFYDKGYGDGEGYFPKRKSLAWPMEIHVESIAGYYYGKKIERGDPNLALFTHQNSGTKNALVTGNWARESIIKIHYDTFYSNSENLRALVFHEFFHFVQSNFIPDFMRTNRWFDDASAAYYEWQAGGTVPNNVQGRYYHLFDGLKPKSDTPENSYVRSVLLKYIVDDIKGGDDTFITEMTKDPPADWFEELIKKTGLDLESITFDFFDKLVSDKYNIFKPYTVWRSIATGEAIYGSYTMLTSDQAKLGLMLPLAYSKTLEEKSLKGSSVITLGEETVMIPTYGAKCIGFDSAKVAVSDLPDGIDPVVTVSGGYYNAIAYLIKGSNEPKRLTLSASETIVLTDFKENIRNNGKYLVLFVNPGEDINENPDYIAAGVKVELNKNPTVNFSSVTNEIEPLEPNMFIPMELAKMISYSIDYAPKITFTSEPDPEDERAIIAKISVPAFWVSPSLTEGYQHKMSINVPAITYEGRLYLTPWGFEGDDFTATTPFTVIGSYGIKHTGDTEWINTEGKFTDCSVTMKVKGSIEYSDVLNRDIIGIWFSINATGNGSYVNYNINAGECSSYANAQSFSLDYPMRLATWEYWNPDWDDD